MKKFKEEEHPRDEEGKFTLKGSVAVATPAEDKRLKTLVGDKTQKLSINFDADNIFPELSNSSLEKMGVSENKKVLLKKGVIDRNEVEHSDLNHSDLENIISQSLYAPSEIFRANPSKENYYHFAKIVEMNSRGAPKFGLVLLDIDIKKEYFEIVHAHFVETRGLERAKNRVNKKD